MYPPLPAQKLPPSGQTSRLFTAVSRPETETASGGDQEKPAISLLLTDWVTANPVEGGGGLAVGVGGSGWEAGGGGLGNESEAEPWG